MFGESLIPFPDMDEAETVMLMAEMQLIDARENKKLYERWTVLLCLKR